jgi:predicted small secreted protein
MDRSAPVRLLPPACLLLAAALLAACTENAMRPV